MTVPSWLGWAGAAVVVAAIAAAIALAAPQDNRTATITSQVEMIGQACSFIDRTGHKWSGKMVIESSVNQDLIMGCEADDGPKPYWVEWRWYCADYYVLYGFNVDWVNGNAAISPARCKADVKR